MKTLSHVEWELMERELICTYTHICKYIDVYQNND